MLSIYILFVDCFLQFLKTFWKQLSKKEFHLSQWSIDKKKSNFLPLLNLSDNFINCTNVEPFSPILWWESSTHNNNKMTISYEIFLFSIDQIESQVSILGKNKDFYFIYLKGCCLLNWLHSFFQFFLWFLQFLLSINCIPSFFTWCTFILNTKVWVFKSIKISHSHIIRSFLLHSIWCP